MESSSEMHGASEVHAGPDFSTLFLPGVNFAIYLVLLVYLYRRFVPPLLKARSVQIASDLKKASSELALAQEEMDTLKKRIQNIAEEKRDLTERFEDEAKSFATLILEEVKERAERLQKDTTRQIERELDRTRKEIRQEIISRAVILTRREIQASLAADEDRRLRRGLLQPSMFKEGLNQS